MIMKLGRRKHGKAGKIQTNDIGSVMKRLKMAHRPFRGSEMSVSLMTGGSNILRTRYRTSPLQAILPTHRYSKATHEMIRTVTLQSTWKYLLYSKDNFPSYNLEALKRCYADQDILLMPHYGRTFSAQLSPLNLPTSTATSTYAHHNGKGSDEFTGQRLNTICTGQLQP
jgi:hypothetical protein